MVRSFSVGAEHAGLAGGTAIHGTAGRATARLLAITTALAAALAAAGPAHAAEQQAFAAGMNYATPAVNIGQGDTLKFTNLDQLARHDIVGENGAFKSDLLAGGESGQVKGVEALTQPQGAVGQRPRYEPTDQRRRAARSSYASCTAASISTRRIDTLSTLIPNGTPSVRQYAISSVAVVRACW